jgi:predicted MFS family arabinose efflux permease
VTTPAATLTAGPDHTRWLAVAAALLAGYAGGIAMGKMAPAVPLLQREFGLSLVQSGWLISTFNAMAASCGLLFGVMADRIGAYRCCLGALLLLVLGGALGALVTPGAAMPAPGALWLLLGARMIEGIGFIALIVSAPALIAATVAPAWRNLAFGFWASYMPLGASLALLASAPLLPLAGWQGLWWAVAAAALAAALLLCSQAPHYRSLSRSLSRSLTNGQARTLRDIRASLATPAPWWLGLAFAMYAIQNHGMLMWLPTYLINERGVSAADAGLLAALAIGANCIGNVFGGWLIQRQVARGLLISITFLITSTLFLLIFLGNLSDGLRYALVVLYNMACGPIPAAALSGAVRYARSPAEVGSLQGLVVQITQLGIFIGPPITAAVVSAAGNWDAALWVLLSASAIGMLAALLVMRHERAEQRERIAHQDATNKARA